LPGQGKLHGPSTHPFGNVQYFVPPVVSAPPTQTTAPPTTAPPTTNPATTAPVTSTPATTAPASTTTGARR
jgi:hypothetical protein